MRHVKKALAGFAVIGQVAAVAAVVPVVMQVVLQHSVLASMAIYSAVLVVLAANNWVWHRRTAKLMKEMAALKKQVGLPSFFSNPDGTDIEHRISEIETHVGLDRSPLREYFNAALRRPFTPDS